MEIHKYRRIRDLREDHDMTQRQIADAIGCDRVQYLRYEKGYRDVPTPILKCLAQIYNTSTDYILELTDDPRPYTRKTE